MPYNNRPTLAVRIPLDGPPAECKAVPGSQQVWQRLAPGEASHSPIHGRAPSQLDLFDYKPELAKLEGKPLPPSVIGGQRYAFIRSDAAVLGPRFKFAKYGQCGAELSEMLPHLSKIVDDITIVKSVKTDQFNHAPAQIFFNTGFGQPGRPSLGSWCYMVLASSRKLAGILVMSPAAASGRFNNWSSGFLPTVFTGVRFRNGAIDTDVSSPAGRSQATTPVARPCRI